MFVVRKFIILCQYLLLACLLFVGHAKKCNQKRTILDSKIQECCLTRGGGASLNFNDDYDREYTSGISFGKDRELFHITVDLKWIFSRLTNKQNWLQLLQMGVEKIKRLYPPYDIWCSYRESALKIIRLIRKQDKKSSLRVFQSSLLHGQYFSTVLDRPILLYIEDSLVVDDGIVVPSLETLLLRKALTNHFVEDLINEKFLFVATTANHVYAETVIKLAQKQEKLSRNQPLEYPLFILLAPKLSAADYFPVSKEKSKPDADQAHHYSNPLQTIKFKKSLELEILFLFRPTSTLTAEQLRYLLLKVLKQFYEARQEEYETYLEAMMNGAKPPPSASTPAAFKGVDSIQFEGLKNEASHSSS